MFYVPFQLRESKTRVTPKGPNFFWARTVKTNIDGTELRFKAPRQKSHILVVDPELPKERYDANHIHFLKSYAPEEIPRPLLDNWRSHECFYHGWAFYGPWFTGVIAELKLSIKIVRVKNYPASMSLFHPRALERIIDDYLTCYFSDLDKFYNNIQKNLAPVDWQPLHHLPVNAARFRITPITHSDIERHLVFVPFAKDMMLLFRFYPIRPRQEPECIKDRYSDLTPVNKLIDNIINSIEVKLSPAAQEDQRIALEGLEDTRLTTDFPPIKWDNLDEKTRAEVLAKIERERIEEYGF